MTGKLIIQNRRNDSLLNTMNHKANIVIQIFINEIKMTLHHTLSPSSIYANITIEVVRTSGIKS